MTIAIQLSAGDFSYVTATDTQVTYTSGAKVDSGKIRGAWRKEPLGAINIAGAGDSSYITTLSQEIVKMFQKFSGSANQLEERTDAIVHAFYKKHVLPFVGNLDDANVPDYSLLIAARHKRVTKLWNVEGMLFMDADQPFACIGIGESVATALLNRLYPMHPTLDSIAVLAAYVIYRVKASVDGCGLNTEIRFIRNDSVGIVPTDRIQAWETVFRKYDRLERQIFYHAMNFVFKPELPKFATEFNAQISPQMKPLDELVKEIEAIQKEVSKVTVFSLSS